MSDKSITDIFFIPRQTKPIPKESMEALKKCGFEVIEVDNPEMALKGMDLKILSRTEIVRHLANAVLTEEDAALKFGQTMAKAILEKKS